MKIINFFFASLLVVSASAQRRLARTRDLAHGRVAADKHATRRVERVGRHSAAPLKQTHQHRRRATVGDKKVASTHTRLHRFAAGDKKVSNIHTHRRRATAGDKKVSNMHTHRRRATAGDKKVSKMHTHRRTHEKKMSAAPKRISARPLTRSEHRRTEKTAARHTSRRDAFNAKKQKYERRRTERAASRGSPAMNRQRLSSGTRKLSKGHAFETKAHARAHVTTPRHGRRTTSLGQAAKIEKILKAQAEPKPVHRRRMVRHVRK